MLITQGRSAQYPYEVTAMALDYTRMRESRERFGLSQKELAERIGVRKQTILFYENGRSQPTADRLALLAQILQTNVSYLLGQIEYAGPLTDKQSRFLINTFGPDGKATVRDVTDSALDDLLNE